MQLHARIVLKIGMRFFFHTQNNISLKDPSFVYFVVTIKLLDMCNTCRNYKEKIMGDVLEAMG